jgi:regulator of sirC expression with transglutaminase-like and TPR domain
MPPRPLVAPLERGGAGDYSRLTFEELARRKDSDVDVAVGAALVARDAYPDLDVASVIAELDRLAAPLFGDHLEERTAEEQAKALAAMLYDESGAGFRGNEDDYYDPKNSLLSDVLTRRLGIPLTLAIVYCEVARRVGVPARGVGFPGHFLVRIDRATAGGPPVIVDPFFHGRTLAPSELTARLERALGPNHEETLESHLAVSSPRATLVRMLTNLKAIYLTRNDRARAHLAVDRIATLLPNIAGPLIERGLLALKLGAREAARSDLTRALTLSPNDVEEEAVRAELAKLAKVPSMLN